MPAHFKDRTGEERYNIQGYLMKIIKYTYSSDILVEFQDENKAVINTIYDHFYNRNILNPYHRSLYGIGFLGTGIYRAKINNKSTIQYKYWNGIMSRSYNEGYKIYSPSCVGSSVCEEWHNFQTFGKWVDNNIYSIGNETMCLDKDILVKNNKVYSPEHCVFVPKNINSLFGIKPRGIYPIGVSFESSSGKYLACICKFGSSRKIGRFKTPEDAFYAYKKEKESHIKYIADEYKSKYPQFPQKLYDALYRYVVELTD